MTQNASTYERFKANQQKMVALFLSLQGNFTTLESIGAVATLETIRQRVGSERLKVLVLGEFKRGKSTLINALLGEDVLPAFAVPCTAVINEIKYGERKRAVVHFKEPLPELPKELSPKARAHIDRNNGRNVPSFEINVSDLEEFVTIPDPAKDQVASVSESPFRLVEIFWPIPLCKDGVEIIDSPGLNEHQVRSAVTVDYLGQVDAVVFVLMCVPLASHSEMEFVENKLRAAGHEDIIFCCNRFDDVKTAKDREMVLSFGRTKLGKLTSFGSDGVFFLSAANALEGRQAHDEAKLAGSGFLPFEKFLAHHLVFSKGKVKLLQPARQVSHEIDRALNETIPGQIKMLGQTTAELQKNLEEIRPQEERAKLRCVQVEREIEMRRIELRHDVEDKVELFTRRFADNLVELLKNYTPQNQIKVLTTESTKSQAQALINELGIFVDGQFSRQIGEWQKNELNPLIEGKLEQIGAKARESVEEIVNSVVEMKSKLIGQPADNQKHAGGWERVLAAGAGWVIGGPGSAMMGGMFGFKEMFKSLIPALAIVIGSILLGIVNPFVLLGLLFGGGALNAVIRTGALTEKLKMQVAEKISEKFKSDSRIIARDCADKLHENTLVFQQQVAAGLKKELESITELVNSVLEKKRQGEARVQERIAQLDQTAGELRTAQSTLQDIIFDIAK